MSGTDLIVRQLDSARDMLAKASNAVEAKQVADLAKAAEVYAKRQKLSKETIRYAYRIKIESLTLLGKFVDEAPKNKGGRPSGNNLRKKSLGYYPPSYGDLGIDSDDAKDIRTLVALARETEDLYEQVLENLLTVGKARKRWKDRLKRAAALAKAEAAPPPGDESCVVDDGECFTEGPLAADLGPEGFLVDAHLPEAIEPGSVRLAFADPPYNEGIDYGEGSQADSLPRADYLQWCCKWMQAVTEGLAKDGSFWVLINDEYAAEFKGCLESCGLWLRQWIIWYESFGVNHSNGFNRTHRHLFWMVKDPKHFVFNAGAVTRSSDRQTKYNDARADPGGKTWDSVWGINPPIPRLTGTCAERIPDFPTQLPLALLLPIVGCASDPGDLVLDPFSGSGTTGEAALRLGRRYVGFEKNPRFAELSRIRLQGVARG